MDFEDTNEALFLNAFKLKDKAGLHQVHLASLSAAGEVCLTQCLRSADAQEYFLLLLQHVDVSQLVHVSARELSALAIECLQSLSDPESRSELLTGILRINKLKEQPLKLVPEPGSELIIARDVGDLLTIPHWSSRGLAVIGKILLLCTSSDEIFKHTQQFLKCLKELRTRQEDLSMLYLLLFKLLARLVRDRSNDPSRLQEFFCATKNMVNYCFAEFAVEIYQFRLRSILSESEDCENPLPKFFKYLTELFQFLGQHHDTLYNLIGLFTFFEDSRIQRASCDFPPFVETYVFQCLEKLLRGFSLEHLRIVVLDMNLLAILLTHAPFNAAETQEIARLCQNYWTRIWLQFSRLRKDAPELTRRVVEILCHTESAVEPLAWLLSSEAAGIFNIEVLVGAAIEGCLKQKLSTGAFLKVLSLVDLRTVNVQSIDRIGSSVLGLIDCETRDFDGFLARMMSQSTTLIRQTLSSILRHRHCILYLSKVLRLFTGILLSPHKVEFQRLLSVQKTFFPAVRQAVRLYFENLLAGNPDQATDFVVNLSEVLRQLVNKSTLHFRFYEMDVAELANLLFHSEVQFQHEGYRNVLENLLDTVPISETGPQVIEYCELLPLVLACLLLPENAGKATKYIRRFRGMLDTPASSLVLSQTDLLYFAIVWTAETQSEEQKALLEHIRSTCSSISPLRLNKLLQHLECSTSAKTKELILNSLIHALASSYVDFSAFLPSTLNEYHHQPEASYLFSREINQHTLEISCQAAKTEFTLKTLFLPYSANVATVFLEVFSKEVSIFIVSLTHDALAIKFAGTTVFEHSITLNQWNLLILSMKSRVGLHLQVNEKSFNLDLSQKLDITRVRLGRATLGYCGLLASVNCYASFFPCSKFDRLARDIEPADLCQLTPHLSSFFGSTVQCLVNCETVWHCNVATSLIAVGGLDRLLNVLRTSSVTQCLLILELIIALARSVHFSALTSPVSFAGLSHYLRKFHLTERLACMLEQLMTALPSPTLREAFMRDCVLRPQTWAGLLDMTWFPWIFNSEYSHPHDLIRFVTKIQYTSAQDMVDCVKLVIWMAARKSGMRQALYFLLVFDEFQRLGQTEMVNALIEQLHGQLAFLSEEVAENLPRHTTVSRLLEPHLESPTRCVVSAYADLKARYNDFVKESKAHNYYKQQCVRRFQKKFLDKILSPPVRLKNFVDPQGRRMILSRHIDVETPSSSLGTRSFRFTDFSHLRQTIQSMAWTEQFIETTEQEDTVDFSETTFECELVKVKGFYYGTLESFKGWFIFRAVETAKPQTLRGSLADSQIKRKFTRVWTVNELNEVTKRRFLHQHTAVELFFKSGQSFLFNFFEPARQRQVLQLLSRLTSLVLPEQSQLSRVKKQWKLQQISNLEYLLKINHLASRSFNDVSQYPVMPWVLNMSSRPEEASSTAFRDLEYPVSAQTEKTREELLSKFDATPDDMLKPFIHGSHFSNPGIVSYFLLRLQPFQQLGKDIQGGEFDVADRLFSSVEAAWRSTQRQIGDTKELIPELYYLPEVYVNSAGFDFGKCQAGDRVNHVSLPSWADYDLLDFFVTQRVALESASKLGMWIDLIFGIRQACRQYCAVYYFTTYEREYALVRDALQKERREDEMDDLVEQVIHFGQTPCQLFKKKHDCRCLPRPLQFLEDPGCNFVERGTVPVEGEVCALFHLQDNRLLLVVKCKPSYYVLETLLPDSGSRKLDVVRNGYKLQRASWYDYKSLSNFESRLALSQALPQLKFDMFKKKYLVSGAHITYSVLVHDFKGKLVHSVKFQFGLVAAVQSASRQFYTAGVNGLVACWELSPAPLLTYLGHEAPVLRVHPFESFGLLVSCNLAGLVLIHALKTEEALHRLQLDQVYSCVASEIGLLVLYSDFQLKVCSVNALVLKEVHYAAQILWVQTNTLGEYVFVGTVECLEVHELRNIGTPVLKTPPIAVKQLRLLPGHSLALISTDGVQHDCLSSFSIGKPLPISDILV